ncbi:MAG: PIN domain-containing protein [Cellulomonadaceae bacterium]|jgi:predicted nucleic acid-binding protein|nr:PIN domain-containing protein [Cellulomonadaceae bacterium]
MDTVLVDADVLAQATPRTVLYLARSLADRRFRIIFSPHIEAEAEKAQRPGANKVSALRQRFGWNIVPDHPDISEITVADTNVKDISILAAAIANDANYIVTGNVRDFGVQDLVSYSMSAVHPGYFLAQRISENAYRKIITEMAARRAKPPNTELDIHEIEISDELPTLFARYQNVFGPAISKRTKAPLKYVFRGAICVTCGQFSDGISPNLGICSECLSP